MVDKEKILEAEVMKLRGIIIDIDKHRLPYIEGKRIICVPASSMIPLVQEARDILLQKKAYDK